MITEQRCKALEAAALEIRKHILSSIHLAGSGHPGGSLSCADLVTALYFDVLNINPKDPQWEDRDRFVMSKGHAAPALYSALALKEYFPKEELLKLRKFGAMLQGHPESKHIPGVDATGGSLGQGYSAAGGMAMAGKLDKKDYYVYALLGDGELDEGLIWETAMSSAHYRLDNFIAFVDHNHLQIDGTTEEVMDSGDVAAKFRAFGHFVQCIDGHSMKEIIEAIDKAKKNKGCPSTIIMETVKGKGVSFMENNAAWHGKAPNEEEYKKSIAELEGNA